MAKTTILVSDLSGEQVTEENGATVKITYPGKGENADVTHVVDLTRDEVAKLFSVKGEFVGRAQQKRGRKAGNGNGENAS